MDKPGKLMSAASSRSLFLENVEASKLASSQPRSRNQRKSRLYWSCSQNCRSLRHAVEGDQQTRLEQPLRRDRGTPPVGVHPLEHRRESPQFHVGQGLVSGSSAEAIGSARMPTPGPTSRIRSPGRGSRMFSRRAAVWKPRGRIRTQRRKWSIGPGRARLHTRAALHAPAATPAAANAHANAPVSATLMAITAAAIAITNAHVYRPRSSSIADHAHTYTLTVYAMPPRRRCSGCRRDSERRTNLPCRRNWARRSTGRRPRTCTRTGPEQARASRPSNRPCRARRRHHRQQSRR